MGFAAANVDPERGLRPAAGVTLALSLRKLDYGRFRTGGPVRGDPVRNDAMRAAAADSPEGAWPGQALAAALLEALPSGSQIAVSWRTAQGRVAESFTPGADGALQPSALLPAGSVALVRRDGVLVRSVALAEAEQLLDWREGLLAFRDTTLAEAAAEFNRYNARKLVVADAAAAELRIGGNFRWDNQDAFVRLLEAGFPVRAEQQADRVVLHSR